MTCRDDVSVIRTDEWVGIDRGDRQRTRMQNVEARVTERNQPLAKGLLAVDCRRVRGRLLAAAGAAVAGGGIACARPRGRRRCWEARLRLFLCYPPGFCPKGQGIIVQGACVDDKRIDGIILGRLLRHLSRL